MSLILNIETSSSVCSVALADNGSTISSRENSDGRSHAAMLAPFIDSILKENTILPEKLDAIAVSKGPGSYTGLRIGVSTSKGLAYALKIPLIGINTLELMANTFLEIYPEYRGTDCKICPMIDARRMEVYTCLFSSHLEPESKIKADIIDAVSYKEILEKSRIVFFGNGAFKCRETIKHKNAIFLDGVTPKANFMSGLSFQAYKLQHFEDIAYFEPFYLKDFVATVPRNKGFN